MVWCNMTEDERLYRQRAEEVGAGTCDDDGCRVDRYGRVLEIYSKHDTLMACHWSKYEDDEEEDESGTAEEDEQDDEKVTQNSHIDAPPLKSLSFSPSDGLTYHPPLIIDILFYIFYPLGVCVNPTTSLVKS